eukprot:TRINITY_DN1771_c0_g1_i1.p1 TRINITY_DN1771_c0_g1~~TRINITY_DN1771_c0_g1_i1.p1  ORF type:complete len:203 (-),score=55.30 TRINITY_DN1771_c0_g1_i1:62-622(-)
MSRIALYNQRVEEVKNWMDERGLGAYVDTLVNEGYDDLEAISRCNKEELKEMLECLKSDAAGRSKLRQCVMELREDGIAAFRETKKENMVDLDAVTQISNEGYLMVKHDEWGDDWNDRWVVMDKGLLAWKKGKKAATPDGYFNLFEAGVKAKRIAQNQVFLWSPTCNQFIIEFENPAEIPDWFPGL